MWDNILWIEKSGENATNRNVGKHVTENIRIIVKERSIQYT